MIKNIDKIHPSKRGKVLNALLYVEAHNNTIRFVDKISIFGSAVTDTCTDNSDIDICIYSNRPIMDAEYALFLGAMHNSTNDVCDIIHYNLVSGRLKQEVDNNGVVVYEF